jgi:hypothetical protein
MKKEKYMKNREPRDLAEEELFAEAKLMGINLEERISFLTCIKEIIGEGSGKAKDIIVKEVKKDDEDSDVLITDNNSIPSLPGYELRYEWIDKDD